jgi:hypothetical protein
MEGANLRYRQIASIELSLRANLSVSPLCFPARSEDGVRGRMNTDAIIGVLGGLSFYLTLAWRTAVSNRGNKLIESGCAALGFFALLAYSNSIRNFPFWLGMCFLTLSLLFALTTLFFVMQRVWRSVGRRKKA